jgi:hypothetical protein
VSPIPLDRWTLEKRRRVCKLDPYSDNFVLDCGLRCDNAE